MGGVDLDVADYLRGNFSLPQNISFGNNQSQSLNNQNGQIRPLPEPSDAEIGDLFVEEALQRQRLAGLTASEAMMLNHNPMLAGKVWLPDAMEEDETDWHPVFRKCRWYDLRRNVADGFPINGRLNPNLPAGAIWSVDEPVIWDVLRPCLEMASRIFVASLYLPFWDAVLDTQPGTHEWNGKERAGDGIQGVPYLAVDRQPSRKRDPRDLRALFDTYARHIAFSFYPVPDEVNPAPFGTLLSTPKAFDCGIPVTLLTC